MANWNEVQRGLGDLMEPLEFSPPYFHVRDFPTDEQLSRLITEPFD